MAGPAGRQGRGGGGGAAEGEVSLSQFCTIYSEKMQKITMFNGSLQIHGST